MKIKDLNHAIDLTIEIHQAVVDGKYSDYLEAKNEMKDKIASYACPLCQFAKKLIKMFFAKIVLG